MGDRIDIQKMGRMLENDPKNTKALNISAVYHYRNNNAKKAEEFFLKSSKIDPKNHFTKGELAKVYLSLKEFDRAAREFRSAIRYSKKNGEDPTEYLVGLGVIYLFKNNIKSARRNIKKAMEINPAKTIVLVERIFERKIKSKMQPNDVLETHRFFKKMKAKYRI